MSKILRVFFDGNWKERKTACLFMHSSQFWSSSKTAFLGPSQNAHALGGQRTVSLLFGQITALRPTSLVYRPDSQELVPPTGFATKSMLHAPDSYRRVNCSSPQDQSLGFLWNAFQ